MTTLDQAFAKVYAQRTPGLPAASRRQGKAVPLTEALQQHDEQAGLRPSGKVVRANVAEALEVAVRRESPLAMPAPAVPTSSIAGRSQAKPRPAAARPKLEVPVAPEVSSAAQAPAEATEEVATPDETLPPGPQTTERLVWPAACQQLEAAAAEEMDRLADGLTNIAPRRRKVVAFSACRRGEGASTVLLCTARRFAASGFSVLVVDADLEAAELAGQLGVDEAVGWEKSLLGKAAISETIVQSSTEPASLLPLLAPQATSRGAATWMSEALDTLRQRYDLVLVNLGPLDDAHLDPAGLLGGIGAKLDALVVVHDVRRTTAERLADVFDRVAALDIRQTAIVENFTQPERAIQ